MTLLVSSRCPSAHRIVVIMISVIIMAGLPNVAAPQFTWPNPDAYDNSLSKTPPPDVDPKVVRDAQQRAGDINRRAETQELTALLEADRQEWQKRKAELDQKLQELDKDLERAIAQAQRDARIRAWANFFQLVALSASLAQKFVPESPTPTDPTPTDPTPPKDGLHVQESYQRVIQHCEGGTCQPVEIRQIEMERIINEAVRPPGGVDSPAIRQIRGSLNQAATKVPPFLCDLGRERCVPMNIPTVTQTAASPGLSSGIRPSRITELPSLSFGEQKNLFHEVKPFISFGADALPGVGTGKGVIEIVTGKDPITGEQVSRGLSALGVVASVVPGGKTASKFVEKAVRFRHYTNRGRLKKIRKDGRIQAGDKNRVFAERISGGTKKPLSPSKAEDTYGLKQGRGRDYVEFNLPPNRTATKRYNPQTRTDEWTIDGDVRLDRNATFTERN